MLSDKVYKHQQPLDTVGGIGQGSGGCHQCWCGRPIGLASDLWSVAWIRGEAQSTHACATAGWTHGGGRALGLGPRLCCFSPGGSLAADAATMAGNQVAELGAVTGDTECYQLTGKMRSAVLL